ncbi:hypothetical protein Tco_1346494 [Tanacetum coccineum]
MASFDYRLNPLYAIKECSSCGALYTTDYCCSNVGLIDKIIRERPPQNCETCGDPVDGLYCRPCAFVRKCLNEGWFTIHDKNEILNTSESSNDDTNVKEEVVNCGKIRAKDRYWKILICYDDEEDYTIEITPILSTEEPVDSLIMEDKHLDAIPATELDEVIKSSVENLVLTPKHSEIVFDFNDDSTSSDDGSPYGEDIEYVDASPPDSEFVSLEVVENVTPEDGEIEDDVLREKLSKINLLIANIEAMNSNPPPSSFFVTKSSSTSLNLFSEDTNTFNNSLTDSETFCFDLEENSGGSTTTLSDYSLPDYEAFYLDDDHIEEKSSGSTTTHANFSQYDSFIFDLSINLFPPADRSDFYHEGFTGELAHIISPSEYDHFYFKIEPELGNFTMDVVEDIFDNPTREPRVYVPNILPTHPTLHLDSDFTLSSDSLGSNLVVSFPSGTRNKIFNLGIFIGVQSMIFLSTDEFSFSFIRDPPLPVIDTLLPFSSKNENKVVNTGILASEEKSPLSSSHRGFKASKLSHHKRLMLIHGDNTPNLGVRHPHFYPP